MTFYTKKKSLNTYYRTLLLVQCFTSMSKLKIVLFLGKASQTNCLGKCKESKYEIVCSDLYPLPTLLNATVEGVSILTIKLKNDDKHLILNHHKILFIEILIILINMNMCYINHVHVKTFYAMILKISRLLLRLIKWIMILCFSTLLLGTQSSLLMIPVLNSCGRFSKIMSPSLSVMMIVTLKFGLTLEVRIHT